MSFVNWMIDSLVSEDIIDLYFIISDLKTIFQTEAEICESAAFDSMTSATVNERVVDPNIPIGKQVF